MSRSGRKGFTLIEILIAVMLMGILITPLYRIFRTGLNLSLKGMLKVETTVQARRILQQIQLDIQQACLPMDGKESTFSPELLVRVSGVPPDNAWSISTFPLHGTADQAVTRDPTGVVWRNAGTVTYSMSPAKNGMYKLVRTERFHPDHPSAREFPGGVKSQVLSEQVNYLLITPTPLNTPTRSSLTFRVHLQLIDSVSKWELVQAVPGNSAAQRLKNGVIADFFTVVNPEFYNRFLNRGWFNPNWETRIRCP